MLANGRARIGMFEPHPPVSYTLRCNYSLKWESTLGQLIREHSLHNAIAINKPMRDSS